MSVRTIGILAILAIAAVAGAAIALALDTGSRQDPRIGTPVFPDLIERTNDVASLKVESNLGALTLERSPKGWTLKESDGYPVIPVKANGSVLDLATLRFHEAKTARPEKFDRLNLLDFDAPGSQSTRVTLQDKGGATLVELLVGNSKFNLPGTKTGGVYLRLPGEKRAWLAAGGLNLSGLPSDWLEPTVLHIAGDRIKRVEIRGPGGLPVVITKRNAKSLVYTLNGVPAGYKVKYDEEPKLIATNLESFELEDARRVGSIAFPPGRTTKTVFETFDGLQVIAESTPQDGKIWTRFNVKALAGGKAAGEAAALTERIEGWVYRIADYRAERLRKSFDALLAPAN